MRFQVERDVLAEAVAWTARALPARPALPVLAGMRLQAGAELTLSSFDYDVSAQASLPVAADEAGDVLVSGRLLGEITRSLPPRPVEIRTEGSRAILTCGSAHFSLLMLPSEDYPALPAMPPSVGTVESDVFASAVAQVAAAAGRDDTLPALTGVRVEIEDGHADPGRHRPVPARGARAALEPGPAGSDRGRAGPGQGPVRHRPGAHRRGRGLDRARPARRERRRDDRLRGRRPAHHHPAARRRVPPLPGAAARTR